MDSLSDEAALVERARKGDANAFEALVLAEQRFVYSLALRFTGDAREAEDIAQEAFLRVWRGLPGFEGRSQFRTWLYRIVVNLCYNRLPRLRQEFTALGIEEEDGEDSPRGQSSLIAGGAYADPARQVEANERQAFLQAQILLLPRTQRVLAMLRFQQDCSYEEIAEVMDLPLGTVKTGLFRARQRLKCALRELEEVYA